MDRPADPTTDPTAPGRRADEALTGAPAAPEHVDTRGLKLALAVVLLTGLLAAALLYFLRERDLGDGRRLTEAYASVVDEQTTGTLQSLDQRLELIAQRLGQASTPEASVPELLETQLQKLPSAKALFTLDKRGQLRHTTAPAAVAADHDGENHVRNYVTRPNSGFVLEAPQLHGDPPRWILHASRPIVDGSGQFAGVVVAVVQASYFDTAWQLLARQSGSAMNLLRTDGTMMLRSPLDDAAMRESYADGLLFTQHLPLGASGSFRMTSPIDGSDRQLAYRTLSQHPDLVVVVGRSIAIVLAQWQQMAWLVMGGWLLGSVILIGTALHLGRLSAHRKGAERRTLALAQRLSMASEAAGLVLWDWDPHGDHWYATPNQTTTLGYPLQEGAAQHRSWMRLVHPDDVRIVDAARDNLHNAGQTEYDYEVRMRHADGSYRWVHMTGRVQERDATGQPTRLIGVRIDVTDRKRADHDRRQMLERITDGFIALDLEWRFVYANQQAGELLGRDPQELIGKSIWSEFPPLPDEQFPQSCRQAMVDQKPTRIEAFYPDLGRWIEDHIYPSPEGMSIYFRDVTQRKSDELALRQAKEHAENLFAGANVMIVRLDANGDIELFNQAAQDLTGYALSDLAGKNWFDVLCPRARYPQVWLEFERLSRHGPVREFENPVLTRNGKELTIAWRNTVLRDGDTVTGTLSFGIDVTGRRQVEQELAESRDQFETLALNSMQGIALIRKGQLSYINPAFGALAGRSADELKRHSVVDLMQWVHPDDRAASLERQRRIARGETVPGPAELRLLHADGRWRWVQSTIRSITLGGENVMLAMVLDIHDRKVAELALRDSEERFRSTFESSAIGMSMTTPEGRWIMVNPALCRILGYTEPDLMRLDYAQISHPDDMPLDRALTAELFDGTRDSFQLEKRYLHRDGHVVWSNLTVALVRDTEGQPQHTVDLIEDISRRKQLELDLRSSQEHLRATLDALPDLMFEVDLQGQYHDYHSPRTDLLVRPPEELLGRRIAETMPADAAATVLHSLHEAMARGHSDGHQIALTLPAGVHWFELSVSRKATMVGQEPRFIVLSRDVSDRVRTQDALRSSEELMRQMAESVSQMFWLMDMQADAYLYISPAVDAVLGCSAAELIADPPCWHRNIHPQDRDRVRRMLELARHTGRYDMQLRLLHPDGSLHWLHARAYPVYDSDNTATPYRCAGVIEDITTRKNLEIREENEREILQYLASGRPIPEILERFVLGYEAMVPGMLGSVLLLDADGTRLRHGAAPHLPRAYCDAIDGGAIGPAAGSCGTAAYRGETVIVGDIANDPLWVDYRELALAHQLRACWSVPIKGLQGQVLGTFAFYFDAVRHPTPSELATIERSAQLASQAIERHLAVRELGDSEARYRTLVEWSPVGIAVHQAGRIVYANPAGAAIMGAHSASQLIGRPVLSLIHPDERAAVQDAIDAVLRNRVPSPLAERRFIRLDGTVIDVETKGSAVVNQGAPAVQVVLRDITIRKKAEADLLESRQQMRVLSSKVLAAQETERRRIAHELHDELGQALTAIKINLQAEDQLRQGSTSAPMAQNIRIVEDALQHVRSLALALRPSMLDDLGLMSALRWLTEQTDNRNTLQVQLLAPDLLERVAPDLETAVFRIVQEALTNVVRHANARRAQVSVAMQGPDTLLVQVRDDGHGFDVAAKRRHATEGNSMGVLGMQERAMLVGAELTIDSAPGQGCTVTLRCPVGASPAL